MLALAPAFLALAVSVVQAPAQEQAPATPGTEAPPAPAVPPTGQERRIASLIGGWTLGPGGSAALAGAGYPRLFAELAQGIGEIDDLGAAFSLDFIASELFFGGTWREMQWRSRSAALAFRLRGGLYADFGATYVISENKSAVGAEGVPGLALSFDAASGLVTLAGDVPIVLTFTDGLGAILAAEVSVAYEALLQPDVTLGARLGGGYRAAAGPAPGGNRGLFELSILIGYRFF